MVVNSSHCKAYGNEVFQDIFAITVTTVGKFGGYKSDQLQSATSSKDESETDPSQESSSESSDTDHQTFVHIS